MYNVHSTSHAWVYFIYVFGYDCTYIMDPGKGPLMTDVNNKGFNSMRHNTTFQHANKNLLLAIMCFLKLYPQKTLGIGFKYFICVSKQCIKRLDSPPFLKLLFLKKFNNN